jgi:methionine synthase II (cobalamin-independent)
MEVDEIVGSIPNTDLAIQWDTVHEVLMIEGARDSLLSPEEHIERLIRVGNYIPPDVELGYHFCYGYAARKHTIEPPDTGLLVQIANVLAEKVVRPLNFVHMPVPRDRSDEAFFEPLGELRLDPKTELYLGLIHMTDGIEGAERRISGAAKVISGFGISTECGLGTRPPETILPLLRLHAEAAAF